jgi:hypothetical protein
LNKFKVHEYKKTATITNNPCIAFKGSGMLKSQIFPRCFGKCSDPWKPGEMEKRMREPSHLQSFQRPRLPEKAVNENNFNFCSKCGGNGGPSGNCSLCGGSGWI